MICFNFSDLNKYYVNQFDFFYRATEKFYLEVEGRSIEADNKLATAREMMVAILQLNRDIKELASMSDTVVSLVQQTIGQQQEVEVEE